MTQRDSGMSKSLRDSVATCTPDTTARSLPPSSTSRTSAKGEVVECSWIRKLTSISPDGAGRATCAYSALKTPGPVDRLEQPDRPGSHHHTPCPSSGSTATHRPWEATPTSIGRAVTTYRSRACAMSGNPTASTTLAEHRRRRWSTIRGRMSSVSAPDDFTGLQLILVDHGVVGLSIDHHPFAHDVVRHDQRAGVRKLDGPCEVVGIVFLICVDEDKSNGPCPSPASCGSTPRHPRPILVSRSLSL